LGKGFRKRSTTLWKLIGVYLKLISRRLVLEGDRGCNTKKKDLREPIKPGDVK